MTTLKTDPQFKKRHVLRSTLLSVPPLVALVFIWRDWDRLGTALWPAVGFFLAWIVAWIVLDAVVLRAYRCPSCRQRIRHPTIPRKNAGDPIHYYCSRCDVEWDTGLREASD